uniref:Putative secreted protein n=1 Tax=Ixodes ricinus TaxID=34613 RepID=A0A6B0UJX2_IXORI
MVSSCRLLLTSSLVFVSMWESRRCSAPVALSVTCLVLSLRSVTDLLTVSCMTVRLMLRKTGVGPREGTRATPGTPVSAPPPSRAASAELLRAAIGESLKTYGVRAVLCPMA